MHIFACPLCYLEGCKLHIYLDKCLPYLACVFYIGLNKSHIFLHLQAMVWDFPLTERFGLIVQFSLLQEHGVERMFQLSGGKLPNSNVQHIIFVTRPDVDLMDLIAQNINREEETPGLEKKFHIFFVPSKSFQCKQKLEVGEICIQLVMGE